MKLDCSKSDNILFIDEGVEISQAVRILGWGKSVKENAVQKVLACSENRREKRTPRKRME